MRAPNVDTEKHPPGQNLPSNSASVGLKSVQTRVYSNEQYELFQPNGQQLRDARSWLARVIARRAVEILSDQEVGP